MNYGIQKVIVGDDNVASTYALFGDGLNRISTVGWGPQETPEQVDRAGVQICRDSNETEPYGTFKGEAADHVNHLPDLEKIYLVFENTRSIDVMIARLEEAKQTLLEGRDQ